jgi:hypothetical protein
MALYARDGFLDDKTIRPGLQPYMRASRGASSMSQEQA